MSKHFFCETCGTPCDDPYQSEFLEDDVQWMCKDCEKEYFVNQDDDDDEDDHDDDDDDF